MKFHMMFFAPGIAMGTMVTSPSGYSRRVIFGCSGAPIRYLTSVESLNHRISLLSNSYT